MHESHLRWQTPHLGGREFEMLVFGHAGYPVVLFPTSLGRYYQVKDFKLVDAAAELVDGGRIKIYCPDGIDEQSWYNRAIHPADRIRTHAAYENVILHEVFEHARRDTGRSRVAVAGCSFGGYHAANLAFRHPDAVGYMISMGGSFDIRSFLDGWYGDDAYFHNPVDYLPGLEDSWYLDRLRAMGIVLGTSEWDISRDANLHFSHLLEQKGIPHWLDVRPNSPHDWPAWREVFPAYLSRIEG